MTPNLIHRFWALIETTQASTLLGLDDVALTQWLLQRFVAEQRLTSTETSSTQDYIRNRLNLIRELADQRQGLGQSLCNHAA